jgi:hypothetical protein
MTNAEPGLILLEERNPGARGMFGMFSYLAGFGAFVCFIIVLIKQFESAGVVHGVIGIITCGIWTFIWGWINSREQGITSLMLIWSVLVVASGGFHLFPGSAYIG